MTEEIGTIKSIPLHNKDIDAGTKAILKDVAGIFNVCTIIHLDTFGRWFIQTTIADTYLHDAESLHLLVVEDKHGNQFPLHQKYWKSATHLRQVDSNSEVRFNTIPITFKEGYYENICTICDAHFQGAKRQPLCSSCCNENAQAMLITIPKAEPKESFVFSYNKTKEIAFQAFKVGRFAPDTAFEEWFELNY